MSRERKASLGPTVCIAASIGGLHPRSAADSGEEKAADLAAVLTSGFPTFALVLNCWIIDLHARPSVDAEAAAELHASVIPKESQHDSPAPVFRNEPRTHSDWAAIDGSHPLRSIDTPTKLTTLRMCPPVTSSSSRCLLS